MATDLARKLGDIKQYRTKIPSSAIQDLSQEIYTILGGVTAILEHYVENPRYLKLNMVNELHRLLKDTKSKCAKEQLQKRRRRTKTMNEALPQSTTALINSPRSQGNDNHILPPMPRMGASKSAESHSSHLKRGRSSKRVKRRISHSSKSPSNGLKKRYHKSHRSDALMQMNEYYQNEESENGIDIEKVLKRKQREKRKREAMKTRIEQKKVNHLDAQNDAEEYQEIENGMEFGDEVVPVKNHQKRRSKRKSIYSEVYDDENVYENAEEADEVVQEKRRRKRRKKRSNDDEQGVYENGMEHDEDVRVNKHKKKRRKKHLDDNSNDKIVIAVPSVRSKSNDAHRHRRFSISEYTDWDTDDDANEMKESVQYFKNLKKKGRRKKDKKKRRKQRKKKEKMMKLKRIAMEKMQREKEKRKSQVLDEVLQTLDVSDVDENEKTFELNTNHVDEQKEESADENQEKEIEDDDADSKEIEAKVPSEDNDSKKVPLDVGNDSDDKKKSPGMDSPEFLAYFEKFIMENSTYVAAELQGLESDLPDGHSDDDDEEDEDIMESAISSEESY